MPKKVVAIHQNKTPVRRHFIAEWAEHRGLSQADIARELGIDKSVVSRWFNEGKLPRAENQEALAGLFGVEPEAILRDPDDDWIARFMQDRSREEKERIKTTLESAFPRRASGDS